MLGNIVDSSSIAMVTFVGHSFENSTHSLDVFNVTFLVNVHVWGQRNNSMLPREHVAGASPLSPSLPYLGELLKMGAVAKFML